MKCLIAVLTIFFTTIIEVVGQDYQVTAFGTELITSDEIRISYSDELNQMLLLYESNRDQYELDRKALENDLSRGNDFVYVNVQLFKSYAGSTSFIIDFVEIADSTSRLDFKVSPKSTFTDPDSLIAKWQDYAKTSFKLFKQGEIKDMSCPVIHCTWSFNHPQLLAYLDYFKEYAPANTEQLVEILIESESSDFRAASAFLLAHSEMSVQELVSIEMKAINDNASTVRNNSMRVIYYAARADRTLEIDLDKVIKAMNYPSFTDRNKALVILRSLQLDKITSMQLNTLAPILLEILTKKDAHNFRNAHLVIMKVSGLSYSIDDLENWQNWVATIESIR